MRKIKLALLSGSFAMGLVAMSHWASADVSYTNFGVGYIDGDYFDVDVDGFELRGNFALNSDFHLLAGLQSLDADVGGDVDVLNFGAGWHTAFSPNMDFVATASILDVDIGNFNTDGIRLTGGFRGMPSSEFEFLANLVFEDIDDVDDDTGYEIGGRYFVKQDTSVGVTLRDVSDLETFRIDIRFDF